jgi:hypothetical protein
MREGLLRVARWSSCVAELSLLDAGSNPRVAELIYYSISYLTSQPT